MKRYETYRDSGILWLDAIPSHWHEEKLKHISTCNDEVLPEDTQDNKLIHYVEISDVDSVSGIKNYTDYTFGNAPSRARRIARKNDVIISTVRTYLKAIATVKEDGLIVSTGFAVIRPTKVNQQFLAYSLLNDDFLGEVISKSVGVSYPAINSTDLIEIKIPIPPKDEQEIIATYLDHKVAQIDTAIAEKEQMLEDLKTYRSAIISEAVTQGLDKTVEMKDSGIEWMGMIPKHWNTNKLKFFADISTGTTPSTANDEYWKEAAENWYTPSDFKEEDIHLKESLRRVSSVAFEKSACRIFKKNVVLVVGIGATLGKIGISSVECSANQQINAIEFYDNVYPLFGAYYLSSLKEVMNSLASTATLAIMNQSITGSIPFVCPTLDEQKEIADYLEKKTESIGSLLNQIKTQVEELKSYKSALITEAVTGKIDLREWKPKEENV